MKLQVANGPLGFRPLFRSFLKTLTQISSVLSRKSYFSGQLAWRATDFSSAFQARHIFYEIMFIYKPKIRKKCKFFLFSFIWTSCRRRLTSRKTSLYRKSQFFLKNNKVVPKPIVKILEEHSSKKFTFKLNPEAAVGGFL